MIALNTMKVDYIALSTYMRKLIATRSILQENGYIVLNNIIAPTLIARSTAFKLPQYRVFEDNKSFQKIVMMSKNVSGTKHITIN